MWSSTDAAFGIPEILEMILLNLDMRTLLYIQRTCHSWLSMIRGSSPIQKALYFTPIETTPDQSKVQNPLLREAFPALFKLTDPDNPEDDYEYDEPTLAAFDMMKTPTKLAAYLRPEASWRRMLLQQPPMCNFGVCRYSTGGYGFSHTFFEVPGDPRGFADGLRMGDFFEALLFGDDVRFATCRLKRVIWWKRIPQSGLSTWDEMEQLMGKTVDSDIVVSLRSHITRCYDSDDDDETPEDEKAVDRIKNVYRELGIQPRCLGKTNKWSHSDWWD
ncbi:hypothetical protein CNMCM8980_007389 [Aspergillus fumigatiaffinis]|uniref:F-box domain-containing protein n=1 Tax=Aspergillus fumigatiaffinis TaxID=340414 RepID=A0A8H4M6S4_9EURO|nr:hypothetical protein CNMCM5878_000246 [Aspergillus fumigatiaffinis]KAF4230432.1 hypothetical protein CNMCM6457_006008 [Aspergillus fumigatiaffinis]KAF4232253.1 hypothetical protein CNMCM6805_010089 [Aspergillus fumigatiaffinis]KAF4247347.1 hypothetical protein CNMCM8980_007389 [Aspergillus fumigatiaffinis]